jgi:hypothetical protein
MNLGAAIPAVSVQVKVLAVVIPSSQRELAMAVELEAFGIDPVVRPLIVLGRLVSADPFRAGRLPSSLVASIEVTAEMVPGAMKVAGMEITGVVVPVATAIWLAVPETEETPLELQVITPVFVIVQEPLKVCGAYAVPPALPISNWPEDGAVFGTTDACVWALLVTFPKPIMVGVAPGTTLVGVL